MENVIVSIYKEESASYQAQEAEKELRKQAKEKMRAEKRGEWHKKAADAHDRIKGDIAKVKDSAAGKE